MMVVSQTICVALSLSLFDRDESSIAMAVIITYHVGLICFPMYI